MDLVEAIKSDKYDVIIINFANPDMVGHTGVIPAAVKAVERVDSYSSWVMQFRQSRMWMEYYSSVLTTETQRR